MTLDTQITLIATSLGWHSSLKSLDGKSLLRSRLIGWSLVGWRVWLDHLHVEQGPLLLRNAREGWWWRVAVLRAAAALSLQVRHSDGARAVGRHQGYSYASLFWADDSEDDAQAQFEAWKPMQRTGWSRCPPPARCKSNPPCVRCLPKVFVDTISVYWFHSWAWFII